MTTEIFTPTDRTKLRRVAARGSYDRETIYAILDEALVCHVGFVHDGQPFVIPTIHWREGDGLYLHGAPASRMLKTASAGEPLCVTVTLLDGLVLARSSFHHSMNYRSVVVLGRAEAVNDPDQKLRALAALVEHVVPGRDGHTRPPSEAELRATQVIRLPISEASAKIRTGGPKDEAEDYALPYWAGLVPLSLTPGAPLPDEKLTAGIPIPDHAASYRRPARRP